MLFRASARSCYMAAKFLMVAELLLLLGGSGRFARDASFTCLDAPGEKG